MSWELLLIISVAGMFLLMLRKFPSALEEMKTELPSNSEPQGEEAPAVAPTQTEKKEAEPEEPTRPPRKSASLETLELSPEAAEHAFKARDFENAAAIFETLVSDDPRVARYHYRLGMCYLELEAFREAREALRNALRLDDTVAGHHAGLGMAEYALGHRLTAVRHIRRAIALDPQKKQYQDLLHTFEEEE